MQPWRHSKNSAFKDAKLKKLLLLVLLASIGGFIYSP